MPARGWRSLLMVSSSLSARIRNSTEAHHRNRAGGGSSGIGSPDQWPGCQLSTTTPIDPSSNGPSLVTRVVGRPYSRADQARSTEALLSAPIRHSIWTSRPGLASPRTRRVSRATPRGTTSPFSRYPGSLILNSLVLCTASGRSLRRRASMRATTNRATRIRTRPRHAMNGRDRRAALRASGIPRRSMRHKPLENARIAVAITMASTATTRDSPTLKSSQSL